MRAKRLRRSKAPRSSGLLLGSVVSLFLHVVLSFFLIKSAHDSLPLEEGSLPLMVTLEPPGPAIERPQIVSPSPATDKVPDTNRLSETNSQVEKEQVQRGVSSSKSEASSRPSQETQKVPQSKPRDSPSSAVTAPSPRKLDSEKPNNSSSEESKEISQKSSNAKPLSLKLDSETLSQRYGTKSLPPSGASRSQASTPQAFSRPPGSGAQFQGPLGTPDYLPNLPDGDLTLLNAKANKYAVFVRRVALQVFGEMQRSGWESLSMRDLSSLTESTVVEAVLTLQGELTSVVIKESSGSARYDDTLKRAVRAAARDPNPPASAVAEDGNIHFIFSSRTWAQVGASGRSNAPVERRWLLLATGLL